MPRDAGTPSASNLRSAAQAVRAAISGQSGTIADALTAIAGALDQAQSTIESLEGKNRELASPDTRDLRRPSTAYVSGDRITGGISVQGKLQSVAGQSLDLTFYGQVAQISAFDHGTGGTLELDITGSVVGINKDGGNVGIGTSSPGSRLEVYLPGQAVASNPGTAALRVSAVVGASAEFLNVGYDPTLHVGYLQPVKSGVGGYWSNLLLNANGGYVGIGTTIPTSPLHVVGTPVYANNAAAVAGGLTAGAFYRTGADPDQICVVH